MTKKNKKTKIVKNRDIEEFVEQEEEKAIKQKEETFQEQRKKWMKELAVPNENNTKKIENYEARKQAQRADDERKLKYWQTYNKVSQIEQEER